MSASPTSPLVGYAEQLERIRRSPTSPTGSFDDRMSSQVAARFARKLKRFFYIMSRRRRANKGAADPPSQPPPIVVVDSASETDSKAAALAPRRSRRLAHQEEFEPQAEPKEETKPGKSERNGRQPEGHKAPKDEDEDGVQSRPKLPGRQLRKGRRALKQEEDPAKALSSTNDAGNRNGEDVENDESVDVEATFHHDDDVDVDDGFVIEISPFKPRSHQEAIKNSRAPRRRRASSITTAMSSGGLRNLSDFGLSSVSTKRYSAATWLEEDNEDTDASPGEKRGPFESGMSSSVKRPSVELSHEAPINDEDEMKVVLDKLSSRAKKPRLSSPSTPSKPQGKHSNSSSPSSLVHVLGSDAVYLDPFARKLLHPPEEAEEAYHFDPARLKAYRILQLPGPPLHSTVKCVIRRGVMCGHPIAIKQFDKRRVPLPINFAMIEKQAEPLDKEQQKALRMKTLRSHINDLCGLNHPRVVRYYGWFEEDDCLPNKPSPTGGLVMEYMPLGSLYNYYTTNPALPEFELLQMALDVCDGMLYLSKKNHLHPNFSSRSILLQPSFLEPWWWSSGGSPNGRGFDSMAKVAQQLAGQSSKGYPKLIAKIAGFDEVAEPDEEDAWDPFWLGQTRERRKLWREPAVGFRASHQANHHYATAVVITEILTWSGPFGRPSFYWPRIGKFLERLSDPIWRQTKLPVVLSCVMRKDVPDDVLEELLQIICSPKNWLDLLPEDLIVADDWNSQIKNAKHFDSLLVQVPTEWQLQLDRLRSSLESALEAFPQRLAGWVMGVGYARSPPRRGGGLTAYGKESGGDEVLLQSGRRRVDSVAARGAQSALRKDSPPSLSENEAVEGFVEQEVSFLNDDDENDEPPEEEVFDYKPYDPEAVANTLGTGELWDEYADEASGERGSIRELLSNASAEKPKPNPGPNMQESPQKSGSSPTHQSCENPEVMETSPHEPLHESPQKRSSSPNCQSGENVQVMETSSLEGMGLVTSQLNVPKARPDDDLATVELLFGEDALSVPVGENPGKRKRLDSDDCQSSQPQHNDPSPPEKNHSLLDLHASIDQHQQSSELLDLNLLAASNDPKVITTERTSKRKRSESNNSQSSQRGVSSDQKKQDVQAAPSEKTMKPPGKKRRLSLSSCQSISSQGSNPTAGSLEGSAVTGQGRPRRGRTQAVLVESDAQNILGRFPDFRSGTGSLSSENLPLAVVVKRDKENALKAMAQPDKPGKVEQSEGPCEPSVPKPESGEEVERAESSPHSKPHEAVASSPPARIQARPVGRNVEMPDDDETEFDTLTGAVSRRGKGLPFCGGKYKSWYDVLSKTWNFDAMIEVTKKRSRPDGENEDEKAIEIDLEVVRLELMEAMGQAIEIPSINPASTEEGTTDPANEMRTPVKRTPVLHSHLNPPETPLTLSPSNPTRLPRVTARPMWMYPAEASIRKILKRPSSYVARALCQLLEGFKLQPRCMLQMGALQGCPRSRNLLGVMLEATGSGLADEKPPAVAIEAVRMYSAAADDGCMAALYNLARCYERGVGVAVDLKEAKRLYEVAAEAGVGAALNRLGWWNLTGRFGIPQDLRQAATLFEKAARAGDVLGANNAFCCFARGITCRCCADDEERKKKKGRGYPLVSDNPLELLKGITKTSKGMHVLITNVLMYLATHPMDGIQQPQAAGQTETTEKRPTQASYLLAIRSILYAIARHGYVHAQHNLAVMTMAGVWPEDQLNEEEQAAAAQLLACAKEALEVGHTVPAFGVKGIFGDHAAGWSVATPEGDLGEGVPGWVEEKVVSEGEEETRVRAAVFYDAPEWPLIEL
ncbi:Tyrosine-protein kinase jak1 [Phlyctochytrium bullatum]|nr:Tyrosine-protein kinase jak1 [Phlyctochytrium bullatum]